MPSFDAVIAPNLVELRNAIEQSNREIGTRFDFKGSSARIDLAAKDAKEITLFADSEFQIAQVSEILFAKLAKRGVDLRYVDTTAKVEKIGGDKVKKLLTVKSGIESEVAKKMQTLVKQSKLKLQAAIQGDSVRISGAKRDDLQAAMALLRKDLPELALTFDNFRD